MSEIPGSAARLVARAGRPSVGRRGTASLVEIDLPALRAPLEPLTEAVAAPGSQPAPPLDVAPGSPSISPPLPAAARPAPSTSRTVTERFESRAVDEAPPLVAPVERVRPPGPLLVVAAGSSVQHLRTEPPPSVPGRSAAVQPVDVASVARTPGAAAREMTGTSARAHLPPVVIDRIEIVTPPARPPASDPLASLAARRAGVSRHRSAR